MIRKLLYTTSVLCAIVLMTACSEDKLDEKSVISVGTTQENEFDRWLNLNYVSPYNIVFKYKYEEIESDVNYYTVPADYNCSVKMAHLLKYLCVEAYDEVAGVEFTRSYFPKMFFLIGEWEYRNNGTFILGTAEGGKKILLSGINYIDPILQGQTSSGSMRFEFGNDVALNLNHYYIKTIHHEFVHIVNQTRPYSTEFKQITGADYVADSWSEEPHDVDFLKRGFITAYSQHSDTEDFAEMASEYIVEPEETWNKWMLEAGAEGKAKLDQKLEIVKDYYLNTWNVDLDKMRRAVHRRQADVVAGKVSLTDLTVE